MPNLRDAVGSAVNSGSLKLDEYERAIDRVAALALAPELGSLLWRMKYGMQRRYSTITADGIGPPAFSRACLLLERAMVNKDHRFQRQTGMGYRAKLFPRFVKIVLVSWLHDKCGRCLGRGVLGVERTTVRTELTNCPVCHGSGYALKKMSNGAPIKSVCPRCCGKSKVQVAIKDDLVRPRACPACAGLGDAILTPREYAALLGVSIEQWTRHWDERMLRLRDVLGSIDRQTNVAVERQLDRS